MGVEWGVGKVCMMDDERGDVGVECGCRFER